MEEGKGVEPYSLLRATCLAGSAIATLDYLPWSPWPELNRHFMFPKHGYYHYTTQSYLAGAVGLEPTPMDLETIVLPLNYTPIKKYLIE